VPELQAAATKLSSALNDLSKILTTRPDLVQEPI
jgi:hypothetical protein